MAAILINIEIAKVNILMKDQPNILSQYLLPFINQVTDYSFLTQKYDSIVG
jgi:hypothetical protein